MKSKVWYKSREECTLIHFKARSTDSPIFSYEYVIISLHDGVVHRGKCVAEAMENTVREFGLKEFKPSKAIETLYGL